MSDTENLNQLREINEVDLAKVEEFSKARKTSVLVVFFDDMKGSTALKERMTSVESEEAFQKLRREHDELLTEIITRGGAGQVVKSTGDGLLAVFSEPSTAVERALEIQEKLHGHSYINVRIGMDMGQVRVEAAGGVQGDLFGRHVDWAARTESLAEGGHILVTRSVYPDASGWISKARVSWKEHGSHIVKEGEPAIEVFEPYNSNITTPMAGVRQSVGGGRRLPRISPTSVWAGAALLGALLAVAPVLHLWAGLSAVLCGVVAWKLARPIARLDKWMAGIGLGLGSATVLLGLAPVAMSTAHRHRVLLPRTNPTPLSATSTPPAGPEGTSSLLQKMTRVFQPGPGKTKVNPKDGAEMVSIPAGEFLMGSNDGGFDEKPQRKVYLDGYWIYKYDVTVRQYRKFCEAKGHNMPDAPSWGWKDDHPMVNVSWNDAKAYCD